MKKTALIIVVVLVAALMSASLPTPTLVSPPTQHLSGTLRFSRANICMIPDYIALPFMENVYLIGKGFPTHGQIQGCRIDATGIYQSFGFCRVFQVYTSRISCPVDAVPTVLPDR